MYVSIFVQYIVIAGFFLILKGIWAGVLHHVVGEHEWFLPYSDAGPSSCRHDPISEDTMRDKEWMKKGSPPHEALRKIVLDKRFLHNIPYYLNFRYNRKAFYVYIISNYEVHKT